MILNKSNIEHALFCIAFQIPVGLITGQWLVAGAVAIAFFVGREHSQREYQITNGGNVDALKWYEGFVGWTKDSVLDVVVPLVCVVIITIIAKEF